MYELNKFKDNPSFEATIIRIDHSFEITFIPSTTTYPELYLLSGYLDNDAGGFILSEFDRNIKICIDEKANKITREKYKTWWLLLVDYFSYSLNEVDREYFKSFFVYSHPWEKIIIIDPRNPHNFFEI